MTTSPFRGTREIGPPRVLVFDHRIRRLELGSLGLFTLLTGAGAAAAHHAGREPGAAIVLGVLSACAALAGIVQALAFHRVRVAFDERGMRARSTWSGERTLLWADIRTARWRPFAKCITLGDGTRNVDVHAAFAGLAPFVEVCRAKVPPAVLSPPDVDAALTVMAHGGGPNLAVANAKPAQSLPVPFDPGTPGVLTYSRTYRLRVLARIALALFLIGNVAVKLRYHPHPLVAVLLVLTAVVLFALRRAHEAFGVRFTFDDEAIRRHTIGRRVRTLRWADVRLARWRPYARRLELTDGVQTFALSPYLLGIQRLAPLCRAHVPAAALEDPDVDAALQLMGEEAWFGLVRGPRHPAELLNRPTPAPRSADRG